MAKQKIRIKVKSFDHKVIDDATKLIIDTAEKTGAIVMGPIPLPTKIEKFTVNKSTFVHKDSREQYEMRTHKRLIDITETTTATIEELSSLSLPSGVDIEIKMIIEESAEEKAKKAEAAKKDKEPKKEKDGSEQEELPMPTPTPKAKPKELAKKKKPAAKKKAPAKKKPAKKKAPAKKKTTAKKKPAAKKKATKKKE